MTTLVYNTNLQQLQGFGKSWKVRSGMPGLYAPIPKGTYTAPPGSLMTGNTSGIGVPYHISSYDAEVRGTLWVVEQMLIHQIYPITARLRQAKCVFIAPTSGSSSL
ncbi:MAG: hypothetical protein OEZ43_11500 [Gammaproteobacteria bacterium]|nr:hypothetical protein [Gammaproteobacteria bacterium]